MGTDGAAGDGATSWFAKLVATQTYSCRDNGAGVSKRQKITPSLFKASRKSLSSQCVSNGTTLTTLAAEIVCELSAQPDAALCRQRRDHTYATLCSGSEVTVLAINALQAALVEHGWAAHTFRHIFACEVDKEKRQWGMEVVGGDACSFQDIRELCRPRAMCARHNCCCDVPRVDGVIVGLSCKDFSKAKKPCPGLIYSRDMVDKSQSASTFFGFLGYVHVHAPTWIIVENSDVLLDSQKPDFGVFQDELKSRGYATHGVVVETSQFGLPQRRRRSYIVSLLKCGTADFRERPVGQVLTAFVNNLNLCRRDPPCLTTVLLDPSSAEVQRSFQTMLGKNSSGRTLPLTPKAADLHMKTCMASNVRWAELKLKAETQSSCWSRLLTAREVEVLAYTQVVYPAVAGVDVGQSMDRLPVTSMLKLEGGGEVNIAPTLLPKSRVWLCAKSDLLNAQRFLVAQEQLMLQGWPVEEHPMPQFSDTLKADLAGNMFSGTVILSVFASMLFAVPWKPMTSSDTVHTSMEEFSGLDKLLDFDLSAP
jgi:hypothetical protein